MVCVFVVGGRMGARGQVHVASVPPIGWHPDHLADDLQQQPIMLRDMITFGSPLTGKRGR